MEPQLLRGAGKIWPMEREPLKVFKYPHGIDGLLHGTIAGQLPAAEPAADNLCAVPGKG
jgi:hypothetical protein